jgi:uncharacterized protein YeaO (DUF488 family)
MNMNTKRAYERPDKEDGMRILVDRLWPRGLTKAKASVDLWLKDIAPSTELRKWFGHDPGKWAEFKTRYRAELKENDGQVALLKGEVKKGAVTLDYGAKDEEHNEALVLQEYLRGWPSRRKDGVLGGPAEPQSGVPWIRQAPGAAASGPAAAHSRSPVGRPTPFFLRIP